MLLILSVLLITPILSTLSILLPFVFFHFDFSDPFELNFFINSIKDSISNTKVSYFPDEDTPEPEAQPVQPEPEASPLRESLRSKFSNFKTSQTNPTSINNGDIEPTSNDNDGVETKSWYSAVKGKLEEKYTEYKNEKEMRKLLNSQNDFEDFTIDDQDIDNENEKLISLPHSFSEESIPKDAIGKFDKFDWSSFSSVWVQF